MHDFTLIKDIFELIVSGDWKVKFQSCFHDNMFLIESESSGEYYYHFNIWHPADGIIHEIVITFAESNEIKVKLTMYTDVYEQSIQLIHLANQCLDLLKDFLENQPKTRLYMVTGLLKIADNIEISFR